MIDINIIKKGDVIKTIEYKERYSVFFHPNPLVLARTVTRIERFNYLIRLHFKTGHNRLFDKDGKVADGDYLYEEILENL